MANMSMFHPSFFRSTLLCLLLTLAPAVNPPASATTLFFWDGDALDQAADNVRQGLPGYGPAYQKLLRDAEAALNNGPFTVTDKTRLPPSGDPHDFSTLSPYFWPIPFLPGGKPYYFRDGKVNPEAKSEAYDRERYFTFMRTLQALAFGYHFSGEKKYARHAANLLRVWFLNPETAMNPHFKYAQAMPGWVDGSALGVIRGSELVQILDTSRLIAGTSFWSVEDEIGLIAWYSRYLDWVTTSKFGIKDGKRPNNHGTYRDQHVAAIALYTGRTSIARDILSTVPERRFARQIKPDGSQPRELRRSRSWEYSLYNLRGLYSLAEMASRLDIDRWHHEMDGFVPLKAATDYLAPYAGLEKEWPYYQLKKEDDWANELGTHIFTTAVKVYGEQYLPTLAFPDHLDPQDRLRLLYNHPVRPVQDSTQSLRMRRQLRTVAESAGLGDKPKMLRPTSTRSATAQH